MDVEFEVRPSGLYGRFKPHLKVREKGVLGKLKGWRYIDACVFDKKNILKEVFPRAIGLWDNGPYLHANPHKKYVDVGKIIDFRYLHQSLESFLEERELQKTQKISERKSVSQRAQEKRKGSQLYSLMVQYQASNR